MELFESPPHTKRTIADTYFRKVHALRASDAFLIKTALLTCIVFLGIFLTQLSMRYTVQTPEFGGTFSEVSWVLPVL